MSPPEARLQQNQLRICFSRTRSARLSRHGSATRPSFVAGKLIELSGFSGILTRRVRRFSDIAVISFIFSRGEEARMHVYVTSSAGEAKFWL